MKLDKSFVSLLKSYLVSRHEPSTIAGNLLPATNEGVNLGSPQQRFDTIFARVVVSDYAGSGVSNLETHITTDDHLQYVHITNPRVITAVHEFAPDATSAPFTLGANAQGILVTGLYADLLSKQVIAGDGLSGGGILEADVSLSVDMAHDFTWTGDHIFQAGLSTHSIYPEANDTYDLGSSTKLWRQSFISQMNAVVFAEMTATLLGGWFVVGKNQGTFAADVASGAGTVDFGMAMSTGQFVLVRAHDSLGVVKAEYLQVGSLVSGTTYNVTRDLAGVHATDPAWSKGTPYQVLGVSGDGRIELNAYDTPRLSILKQGATYGAASELVRMGDLNGWGPVTSEQYGWGVGNYAANKYAYYTETEGLIVRGTIRADSGYLGDLAIDGILTIGTSGEIRQGTGALGTDFTGLRIWKDGSIGRIGGYNSNNLQWYASTDGKLYAGGGSVKLDSDGISIKASTSPSPADADVLKIVDGDGDPLLSFYVYDAVALGGIFRQAYITASCDDDNQIEAYLRASTVSQTKSARCGLAAVAGTGGGWSTTTFNLTSEYDAAERNVAELSGFNVNNSSIRLRLYASPAGSSTDIWLEEHGKVGLQNILSSGYLDLAEIASPGTPSSGYGRMYADGNGFPQWIDDAGVASHMVTDVISLNVHGFYYYGGAGTITSWYSQGRSIPNSGTPGFAFTASIPYSWKNKSVYLDLFIGTSVTSSANVVWEFISRVLKNGMSPASYYSASNNVPYSVPGTGDRVIVHSIPIGVDWNYNHNSRSIGMAFEVWRDTANALDLFPASFLLFGAQLRAA